MELLIRFRTAAARKRFRTQHFAHTRSVSGLAVWVAEVSPRDESGQNVFKNPKPRALRETLAEVQKDDDGIFRVLHECCDRMDACKLHVRALLPEKNRRERILEAGQSGKKHGSLRGLLLGVKDIIAVEGFPTVCGSSLPPEAFDDIFKLHTEAPIVRRLTEAGMIIAGRTVTTEFAFSDPGATANPWNIKHTPGGSSSGSAAAVATGEVHVALGSQTSGSVNRPAAFCGVCGFKPSYGRIPTDGVAINSPSVDTLGFFTPDAAGMGLVAAVAVEDWDNRPFLSAMYGRPPVLGVPKGAYLNRFDKLSLDAFEKALEEFASRGVTVKPIEGILDDIEAVVARHQAMTRSEWAHSIYEIWSSYAPLFRSKTAMEIVLGLEVPETEAEAGRAGRIKLRSQVEDAMNEYEIDLWVMPGTSQGPAPLGLDSTGDSYGQVPWTHAGVPTFSLPSGVSTEFTPPLPLGLQFAAKYGDDEALLGWCSRLEQLLSEPTPEANSTATA